MPEINQNLLPNTERPVPQEQPAVEALPEQSAETLSSRETESLQTEQEQQHVQEVPSETPRKIRLPKKTKSAPLPQVRDELTVRVEKIMEEGLEEAYKAMTPVQQQEFKIKGEETANKIRTLLKATHVKIKKIVKLLFDWLKMLPGVNKFYLEQEAKIKADKIASLKHFDQPR